MQVVTMSQDYHHLPSAWVMVYGFGADVSHLSFSIPCSRIVRDIRHSRSHMRHPGDESSTF